MVTYCGISQNCTMAQLETNGTTGNHLKLFGFTPIMEFLRIVQWHNSYCLVLPCVSLKAFTKPPRQG